MKVLIVDDSPDAVALAKARLGKEGLELLCADGGKAGLELASRERPDLILLDVNMPDMSGFDVCRALKADGELCMIPVVFLSGSGGPEDKVKGLDLGAVDYVTKPFDAFELQARVNAALRTKRLQDLLVDRARIDPLTGLCNRGALMEQLDQEWARVQRYERTVALVMADLDHFKRVNDTFGHQAGDMILERIATTMMGQCREADTVGRYGGEEIAILLPESDCSSAAPLAERCRRRIAGTEHHWDKQSIRVTCSFGVACSRDAATAEDLVGLADTALYKAKQGGRNRVCAHEESAVAPVTP